MSFREYYLTEIKTEVDFGKPYSTFVGGKLISYLHIDNTTKDVIVNIEQEMLNNTTFKILIKNIKTDKLDDIFTFEFFDSNGNITATGRGLHVAKTLFGAIEKVFAKLISDLPNTATIIFSSERNEKERIGIYNFFIKKIKKVYPYILTDEDFSNNGLPPHPTHKFYGFTKSKDRYKQIHKTTILASVFPNIWAVFKN